MGNKLNLLEPEHSEPVHFADLLAAACTGQIYSMHMTPAGLRELDWKEWWLLLHFWQNKDCLLEAKRQSEHNESKSFDPFLSFHTGLAESH